MQRSSAPVISLDEAEPLTPRGVLEIARQITGADVEPIVKRAVQLRPGDARLASAARMLRLGGK